MPQIKRAPWRPESINLVLGGFLQQKIGFRKGTERADVKNRRGNIARRGAVAGFGGSPYMGADAGQCRSLSKDGVIQP